MKFEFDNCLLDTARQELWRDGHAVHVEPQVLAVLEYLASNHERVVTKIELLDEVWGDRFVSESALTSRIKLARKACGDNGREQRIVKTVHSRGYRFVAAVSVRDGNRPIAPSQPAPSGDRRPDRVVPAADRTSTTVFGRADELDFLDAALTETLQGRRGAVFVYGGVGAGKSTLVAEFLERNDQVDEWRLVEGRCVQTRGGMEPYFSLLDALGRLARAEPDIVVSTLDRVAPTWLAQLPSLLDDDTTERLERRLLGSNATRMLREGVNAFEALTVDRPLVLVLEDLQWADDCTLDVIDLLIQRSDPIPLLVLGTARGDASDITALISSTVIGGRASLMELGALDREAVALLARDRLAGAEVPDGLVDAIARRCDGVPLFADEIVASWLRSGQIVVDDGSVVVTESIDALEATIPPSLPPLVERELATLGPDELGALEVCAVAGTAFDAATVGSALERPVEMAESLLAEMSRRRGFIGATGANSWPDGTISAAYAFTHQLFREVVYERIPTIRRATLHASIGRALEARLGSRAGEMAVTLADHFLQAGDILPAVEHLRRAGEQANARDAHTHAIDFLDTALEKLDAIEASYERDCAEGSVRTTLGPALVATKGWFDPSVSANYERAFALCADDPVGQVAAAARYALATVSELRGQFDRTETLLTPLLDAEAPGHLALEAHELVACSTFHQGAFNRSLDNANVVLESWDEDAYSILMARIAEHPASSCSSWSSLALWALGRSDESLRLAKRAVELGRRNQYALSTALQQRAMLHQLRNEPEACIEWAERCRAAVEGQELSMRAIQADIYKGWALGTSGQATAGADLIESGLARFQETDATLNEAYYLALHADVLLHGGEPGRARDLLLEASRCGNSRTYFFEPEMFRLLAGATLAVAGDGALDAARAALDESRSVARRQGSRALEFRTLIDRVALERESRDASDWRDELRKLLTTYDGQEPTPDTRAAHAALDG